MGLFFEDTKPPEPLPQVMVQETKHDWSTALIAGMFAVIVLTLTAALKAFAFVAKPTFGYLFTFEGRSKEQITTQMAIATTIVLAPLFMLYQIPFVRDGLTLRTTHTLNHSANGQRISFPDRSLFTPTDRRIGHVYDSKTYITYAGYTEAVMQKMSPSHCQLVTRGKRIGLASEEPPTNAEGFENEVEYEVEQRVSDMKTPAYMWYVFSHPGLWMTKRSELANIKVRIDVTSSWKEFTDNWRDVFSPPNMNGWKVYTLKALALEHATACF